MNINKEELDDRVIAEIRRHLLITDSLTNFPNLFSAPNDFEKTVNPRKELSISRFDLKVQKRKVLKFGRFIYF